MDEVGALVSRVEIASDDPIGLDQSSFSGEQLVTRATNMIGPRADDSSAWLVGRYSGVQVTSTSRESPGPALSQTTHFEWSPGKPEPTAVIDEPGSAAETDTTSGFLRRSEATRDFDGHVSMLTVQGSGQTRKSEFKFAHGDLDRIFPAISINTLGHTTSTWRHASWGLVGAEDDANGVRTTQTFDAFGRLRTSSRAGEATIRRDYFAEVHGIQRDRNWTVRSRTDGHGTSWETFDPVGRVIRSSETVGNRQADRVFTYSELGDLASATLPFEPGQATAPSTVWIRDGLGRVIETRAPSATNGGQAVVRRTEHLGRRLRSTDERGVVVEDERDILGRSRSISVKDPASANSVLTKYEYWHSGALRRVIHPPLDVAMTPSPGVIESVATFDRLGRQETLSEPNSGITRVRYNAFGEVKRVEDANAGVTTIQRDALGRPTRTQTPTVAAYPSLSGPDAQNTTVIWDSAPNGIGQMASTTSKDGVSTSVTYDEFGRPKVVDWAIAGAPYRFETSYDAYGRQELLKYPSSNGQPFVLEQRHDGDGLVAEIWDASNPASKSILWRQIDRNVAGQSTDEQFGSSTLVHRSYDRLFQLKWVEGRFADSNTTFQRSSFDYDDSGFLKGRRDLELGIQERFEHDFLGRLKKWRVEQNCSPLEWSYAYDNWGNLRSKQLTSGPSGIPGTEWRYTSPGNTTHPQAVKSLIEGSIVRTYEHLAGGQVSRAGDVSLSWTPFGVPFRMVGPTAETKVSFDGFRQRALVETQLPMGIRRVVNVGGMVEVRSTTGSMQAEFVFNVFANDQQVAQVRRAINPATERVEYIHPDSVGSPEVVTTETVQNGQKVGQVTARNKYDPFGQRRHPNSVAYPLAQKPKTNSSIGFTGADAEDEFGIADFGGRVYDSRAGQFLSVDPFSDLSAVGLNRYSYVKNSPLARVDPSGFVDVSMRAEVHFLGVTSTPRVGSSPSIETIRSPGVTPGVTTYNTGPSDQDTDKPDDASYGETAGDQTSPDPEPEVCEKGCNTGEQAMSDAEFREINEKRFEEFGASLKGGEWLYFKFMMFTGGHHFGAAVTGEGIDGMPLSGWGRAWEVGVGLVASADFATTVVSLGSSGLVKAGAKGIWKRLTGISPRKAAASGGCFAAGTIVLAARGAIPIEEVREGDLVWAQDDLTAEVGWYRVSRAIQGAENPFLEVRLESGETIFATAEHPFGVVGVGWVPADQLAPGDTLTTATGARSRVASIAPSGRRESVFNLSVEGAHSFFVGESGVLVHNMSVIGGGKGAASTAADVAKRPRSFRKKTVEDAWDNAPVGSRPDTKACPTCRKDVEVAPGEGHRDWDVDHQPPWSKRDMSGKDRKGVLDDYNTGTRLECPGCNRSRGGTPAQ